MDDAPTLRTRMADTVLHRHPARGRQQQLQAWDAADAYALDVLADTDLPAAPRCLVVGDRFGALSIGLVTGSPGARVAMMSDSSLAHEAVAHNLRAGGHDAETVESVASTASPEGPLDLLLLRVPRSLAFLEDQLRRIRPALGPATTVLGTAMAKHVHTSTLTTIEGMIGPTTTSLARRKARLVHVTPDLDIDPGPSPFPVVHAVEVDGEAVEVVAHAGVFALGKLDVGTRLLLASLPDITPGTSVVDLGCGDGVVGLVVARRHPEVTLTFSDESYMAVASARAGWERAHGDRRRARFLLGDGMAAVGDASVDLVLVNPPFHDDQVVGDAIAWEMFEGARRALRPGGRIIVVGNRHLAHHAKLARLFGGSRTRASSPKFVVLEARRRPPSGRGADAE